MSQGLTARPSVHRPRREGEARPIGSPERFLRLFALPAVVMSFVFVLLPGAASVTLSLFDWNGVGEPAFVGLRNYADLLGRLPLGRALANTFLFAALFTLGTVTIGALLAAAIDRRVTAWRLYKVIFFLPVILPMTVTGIFWAGALDVHFGLVNEILRGIDRELPQPWLAQPNTALITIALVAIWQFAAFPMIILLAAMQGISPDIHEQATLDGVGALQRLRTITLPLIGPVIATVVLLQLIWSFNAFDLIWTMTRGGPGDATAVLGTVIYRQGFTIGDLGGASAIAVVSSLIIMVVSLLYLRRFRPAGIGDV
jgi:ABC-type sugar transport system permease subunit